MALWAILGILGCVSFDYLTRIENVYPEAKTCSPCHIDIHKEWAESPHARAFTNANFRNATNQYQFESCLGCHTPVPELNDNIPATRSTNQQEGVTCAACHLEEGKMSGPIDPTGMVAPHPVQVSQDRYRDSRFCHRCHQGTYLEWLSSTIPDKSTCQDCHMPEVMRKMTQAKDTVSGILVAMEKEVKQKRHLFTIDPNFISPVPIGIEYEWQETRLLIKLYNDLPHALPTGDFGVRIAVLEVISLRDNRPGEVLSRFEMVKEMGTAIPSAGMKSWEILVPVDVKSVWIRLYRHGWDNRKVTELFGQEVTRP